MNLPLPTMQSPGRKWLVIYTRARWEKKVDLLLNQIGVISYCPVRKVINQWADRQKMVEIPLFTSYVFVNVNLKEEHIVRQTYGVINFIYYLGKPAVIRDADMQKLTEFLAKNPDAEIVSINQLSTGDRVRIKQGVLCNQEGQILEINGKMVLMAFDNLDSVLISRVSKSNLALI